MLERRHRLTRSTDFSATIRRGRRAGTRTVVVHLARSAGAGPGPRVGFIVSRSVGNAVRRNRVRRRLRHLAHDRLAVLPPDGLLVVRALPASGSATYDALGRDLDVALCRLGHLSPGAVVTSDRPRTGVS